VAPTTWITNGIKGEEVMEQELLRAVSTARHLLYMGGMEREVAYAAQLIGAEKGEGYWEVRFVTPSGEKRTEMVV